MNRRAFFGTLLGAGITAAGTMRMGTWPFRTIFLPKPRPANFPQVGDWIVNRPGGVAFQVGDYVEFYNSCGMLRGRFRITEHNALTRYLELGEQIIVADEPQLHDLVLRPSQLEWDNLNDVLHRPISRA